jgi:hypothetical protein
MFIHRIRNAFEALLAFAGLECNRLGPAHSGRPQSCFLPYVKNFSNFGGTL